MSLITGAGSTLAISVASPATEDATGYAALTYTKIGNIEKIGPVGPQFAKIEFQPLDGPKQKLKGAADNGSLSPSLGHDSADAGQNVLRTAGFDKTNKLYSMCMTLQDGAKRYFGVRVFGYPENVDGANAIVAANPSIEVCTEIVRVAAA